MFITEQSIRPKCRNQAKNRLWKPGMALANRETVKVRFSYKEFTVVLGILVALIVVITLWIGQQTEEEPVESTISFPEITLPDTKTIKKTMIDLIW